VQERDEESAPQPAEGPVGRLLGSASNLLATVLTIGRTRLELLSIELQLEVRRIATLLVLAFVALFAAGVSLMLAGLAVILIFWDTHRVLAALVVTACFVGIALSAGLILTYKIRSKPRPLAGTLAELATDSRRLRGEQ
jgi:uncharacterized membrane protein YqjE